MNGTGGIELVPPNKTVYVEGERLDLTGLKAYGTSGIRYEDGTNVTMRRVPLTDVMSDLEDRPLTVEDTYVTVSGCDPTSGDMRVEGGFEITVVPSQTQEPKATLELTNVVVNRALTANIKLTVPEGTIEGKLIVALYNGKKIVKFKVYTAASDVPISFDSIGESTTMKVMWLDGIQMLRPLSGVNEISL